MIFGSDTMVDIYHPLAVPSRGRGLPNPAARFLPWATAGPGGLGSYSAPDHTRIRVVPAGCRGGEHHDGAAADGRPHHRRMEPRECHAERRGSNRRGEAYPAGSAWATKASWCRAAIRPARRSASAFTRSTSCPAWVMSRPARVKSAKRRRFGRAVLKVGGSARDFSALRTL